MCSWKREQEPQKQNKQQQIQRLRQHFGGEHDQHFGGERDQHFGGDQSVKAVEEMPCGKGVSSRVMIQAQAAGAEHAMEYTVLDD